MRQPGSPAAEATPPGRKAEDSAGPLTAADGSLRLLEGVELLGEYEGSGYKEPRYMVRRSDGQLVQLTNLLYFVAEALDGKKTHEQIAEEVSAKYGRAVSADNVSQLVSNGLAQNGLIASPEGKEPQLKKPDPMLRLKLRATVVPEKGVNFIAGLLRPLFWPPVMLAVLAAFIAVDVWYFVTHGIGQSLRSAIYSPLTILMVYGLLVVSVFCHELGHATACRYSGARPGKIGFGVYIIWPALYTDVTDIYSVGKGGRVRTDLGGMYFNMIFAIAIAGVYFVTGFEPILALILLQNALMLFNLMPFLRMDGYFVISDLTGVPDLFSRIKPTLASLLPWRQTPKAVTELKPAVRFVVTGWVILVIPVLAYVFSMMVIGAPRILATGWDSLLVQLGKLSSSFDKGDLASAAISGIEAGMIVLPTTGMTLTFSKVLRRLGAGYITLLQSNSMIGAVLGVVGASVIGVAGYVLMPNGDYKPIQPQERWTIDESTQTLNYVHTGRPGLSEDREQRLGGAPMLHEQSQQEDRPEADSSPTPSLSPRQGEDSEEDRRSPSPSATPTPTSTSRLSPSP